MRDTVEKDNDYVRKGAAASAAVSHWSEKNGSSN